MGDTFNAQRCSNGEPLGLDYTTPDRMSPERRFKHGLMLDPAGARIIVVGGESDCAKLDDAWQLPLTGDPVWSRLTRASQGEGCVRAGLPCLCYCS